MAEAEERQSAAADLPINHQEPEPRDPQAGPALETDGTLLPVPPKAKRRGTPPASGPPDPLPPASAVHLADQLMARIRVYATAVDPETKKLKHSASDVEDLLDYMAEQLDQMAAEFDGRIAHMEPLRSGQG